MNEKNVKIETTTLRFAEVIARAGLQGHVFESIDAHGVVVLLPHEKTAMDIVRAMVALHGIQQKLRKLLMGACTKCDGRCGQTPCELWKNPRKPGISVPDWMLESVGIPAGAKLDGYTTQDPAEIRIHQADYRYDLKDVDPELLLLLRDSGVCIASLQELLKSEDTIWED